MKRENVYRILILIMAILLVVSFWKEEKAEGEVKEQKQVVEESKSYAQERDEAQASLEELIAKDELLEQEKDSMADLIAYIAQGKDQVSSGGEKQIYLRTMDLIRDLEDINETKDIDNILSYFHPGYMQTRINVFNDNGIKVDKSNYSDLKAFLETNVPTGQFSWHIQGARIAFATTRENVGTIALEGNVESENPEEGKINSKNIILMTYKEYDGKWLIGNMHVSRYEVW